MKEGLVLGIFVGFILFLGIPMVFGKRHSNQEVEKPTRSPLWTEGKTIKAITYKVESDTRYYTYNIDEIQIDGVIYLIHVEKGIMIPKVILPAEKPK